MKTSHSIPNEFLPKLPHWRYLLINNSEDPRMGALYAYLDANGGRHNLLMEVDNVSLMIFNTPPMRSIVESMILERCDGATIASTLRHKFGIKEIDGNNISLYKILFFDVDSMNNYEMAKYRMSLGESMPKIPPVPSQFRPAYTEYMYDEVPELDEDQVLKTLAAQSFFRAQELLKYGWEADSKYLAFMKATMDVMEKRRSIKQSQGELPDEYLYPIEYPDRTAISLDELREMEEPENE